MTCDDKPARLHDDEVSITPDLVRRLVASAHPQWSDLPLQRMPSTGTDNAIFRLGDGLGLRLPRIGWAKHQIAWESEWLPRLAPLLPFEVPEPIALGEPAEDYPFPWLVFKWIEGDDLMHIQHVDFNHLARDVATYLIALESIDVTDAPIGGRHQGRMYADDKKVKECLYMLRDQIDADQALTIWEAALGAGPWGSAPVWVHGDLLPGNVIVRDGSVAGIIDWASAGAGDPACELMLAWALPPAARALLRSLLPFDEASWARARGLVVEQAVSFITYYAKSIPEGVVSAMHRLNAVLTQDI